VITHLDSKCVVSNRKCTANLKRVLARGYPKCEPGKARTEKLAIVGAAPSLSEHLDELREWSGDIWAVNGAYNYLQDRGVIPSGFLGVDPLPGLADYLKRPHEKTTFLISGLCDKKVFNALKGHKINVWFPEQLGVKFPKGLWLVGGGTTGLTRAPFLARMMGYKDLTMFGADSSFAEGERYCYRHGTFIEDSIAPVNKVSVQGKVFETELCMMKQVSQLGVIAMYWDGDLKFKCGGLLDAYLKAPVEYGTADAA
jgi:hypothetical protein